MHSPKLLRDALLVLTIVSFMVLPAEVLDAKQNKTAIGDKIPDLILEGANGKQYNLANMQGKVVILVMGPKEADANSNMWVKKILQAYPNNDMLNIFAVYDMRGIPFFIPEGFVRGKVKEKQKDSPVTILMDWKQKVNNLLGANKNATDIFVIDTSGILASHQVGTYSGYKYNLLIDVLEKLVKTSD